MNLLEIPEGTKVRVIRNESYHDFKIGEIVEALSVNYGGGATENCRAFKSSKSEIFHLCPYEIREVKQEERISITLIH